MEASSLQEEEPEGPLVYFGMRVKKEDLEKWRAEAKRMDVSVAWLIRQKMKKPFRFGDI